MSLSQKQQEIVETYLSSADLSTHEEPRVRLEVTRRQLRFLIEAVDQFLLNRCPMAGRGDECSMLSWEESPVTGALERVCAKQCQEWMDELLSEVVPNSFPARC